MTIFEVAAHIPMGEKIAVKTGFNVEVMKAKEVCDKYVGDMRDIEELLPNGYVDSNGIAYFTINAPDIGV